MAIHTIPTIQKYPLILLLRNSTCSEIGILDILQIHRTYIMLLKSIHMGLEHYKKTTQSFFAILSMITPFTVRWNSAFLHNYCLMIYFYQLDYIYCSPSAKTNKVSVDIFVPYLHRLAKKSEV